MSYKVEIVRHDGTRETILSAEESPRRARGVALGVRRRSGRKIVISQDGKELRGGPNALDGVCYQHWLENHQLEGE